jgi:hypothetical protein
VAGQTWPLPSQQLGALRSRSRPRVSGDDQHGTQKKIKRQIDLDDQPPKKKRPPVIKPSARKLQFFENVQSGNFKSEYEAAIDAGYSESVARNTRSQPLGISKSTPTEVISEALDSYIDPDEIAQIIAGGIKATRRLKDGRFVPSHDVRDRYLTQYHRFKGMNKAKVEAEGGGIHVHIDFDE